MAAFPLTYAVILNALYLPLALMLLGLIFRGGVRIPLQGRRASSPLLGQGLHRQLRRRHLLPGRHPRRLYRGHPSRGAHLSGRRLGLAWPVSAIHRFRPRRRLRAAWLHLADPEDRRRTTAACEPLHRASRLPRPIGPAQPALWRGPCQHVDRPPEADSILLRNLNAESRSCSDSRCGNAPASGHRAPAASRTGARCPARGPRHTASAGRPGGRGRSWRGPAGLP